MGCRLIIQEQNATFKTTGFSWLPCAGRVNNSAQLYSYIPLRKQLTILSRINGRQLLCRVQSEGDCLPNPKTGYRIRKFQLTERSVVNKNTSNRKSESRKHRREVRKRVNAAIQTHKIIRSVGTAEYTKKYDSSLANKQKLIFDSIGLGSVVYAVLPFSEKELAKIGETHQYRPHVIIGKSGDTAYALSCSTSNAKTCHKVHVSKRDVFDRSTFIYTNTIYTLNASHIIDCLGTLSSAVLRKVRRMMPFSSEYLSCFKNISLGCVKGDVICYENSWYYVFVETDSKLYLHSVISECTSEYCIPLPERIKDLTGTFVDTETEFTIPADASYIFLSWTGDGFIREIQTAKQLKARKKHHY